MWCWPGRLRPAVLAAAALRCIGGQMLGRLHPLKKEENDEIQRFQFQLGSVF